MRRPRSRAPPSGSPARRTCGNVHEHVRQRLVRHVHRAVEPPGGSTVIPRIGGTRVAAALRRSRQVAGKWRVSERTHHSVHVCSAGTHRPRPRGCTPGQLVDRIRAAGHPGRPGSQPGNGGHWGRHLGVAPWPDRTWRGSRPLVRRDLPGRAGPRSHGVRKLYPSGSPLRDAPQLRLMARFETLVAHPLRLRREVLLPGDDEQRAWDAMIIADDGFGFAEG